MSKRNLTVSVLTLVFLSSSSVFALVPNPNWGPNPDKLLSTSAESQQETDFELLLTGKAIESQAKNFSEETKNWQNKSPEDGIEGTGLSAFYQTEGNTLTFNEKPIIVAVLDGGVDPTHEYIKDHLYTDPITGDHGWNFLGNRNGSNIECTTLEVTREYVKCKNLNKTDDYCERVKKDYEKQKSAATDMSPEENMETINGYLKTAKELVLVTGEKDFTYASLQTFSPTNEEQTIAKDKISKLMDELTGLKLKNHDNVFTSGARLFSKEDFVLTTGDTRKAHSLIARLEKLVSIFDYRATLLKYALNENFDPRKDIIGDDPDNFDDNANEAYGNNDVMGPTESAKHGTHVAGIILQSAENENVNVQIMPIRVVPCGGSDEYDKDVANGIVYAVKHGAKIINGSFGKAYSPHQNLVKKAVKYAEEKGVIIVHAAGNSSNNNDDFSKNPNYPNRYQTDGSPVSTWVEVGASDQKLDKTLPAFFSNYGKKSVDLFAPGVGIISTAPENKWIALDGTSMASPVVAGVLASVYSQYYDKIEPASIRDIVINKAVRKDSYANLQVRIPGSTSAVDTVPFSSLSITGGIVDGYEAFKLASKAVNK